jgi:hypothetical protein
MDNIFLEYSLPCKLKSKMIWKNILPHGHEWNKNGWNSSHKKPHSTKLYKW